MVVIILTAFTLVAFAANSLLCRMALGGLLIDPVSFTSLRLASGALALLFISRIVDEAGGNSKSNGSWMSGLALFVYAIGFSLSYVTLNTGMGALILFGSVQVTMLGAALKSGERPRPIQWIGSAAAFGGLIYLVMPGISAPDPLGALLMCIAGIAWGVYSIRGKGVPTPVVMTTGNFIRTVPMVAVISAVSLSTVHLEPLGILLALVSGSITSGMGYILWYMVLRRLTTTQASIVQLTVPVLAAFGGVTLLSEQMSARLIFSSILILGGVALAVVNVDTKKDSKPLPHFTTEPE